MTLPEKSLLNVAMDAEMKGLMDSGVWDQVLRPHDKQVVERSQFSSINLTMAEKSRKTRVGY